MLKISVVEGSRRRRAIVEGKLIPPWATELTTACEKARAGLQGREPIVDLRSLTAISPEGESVLLQLMKENVKSRCGLFIKEVLRQLARKTRRRHSTRQMTRPTWVLIVDLNRTRATVDVSLTVLTAAGCLARAFASPP